MEVVPSCTHDVYGVDLTDNLYDGTGLVRMVWLGYISGYWESMWDHLPIPRRPNNPDRSCRKGDCVFFTYMHFSAFWESPANTYNVGLRVVVLRDNEGSNDLPQCLVHPNGLDDPSPTRPYPTYHCQWDITGNLNSGSNPGPQLVAHLSDALFPRFSVLFDRTWPSFTSTSSSNTRDMNCISVKIPLGSWCSFKGDPANPQMGPGGIYMYFMATQGNYRTTSGAGNIYYDTKIYFNDPATVGVPLEEAPYYVPPVYKR